MTQLRVFCLTFLAMVSRHSSLSLWSFVTQNQQKYQISKYFDIDYFYLSTLDFTYLFFYSLGNYFSGIQGRKISQTILIPTGLALSSLCYLSIILLSLTNEFYLWLYLPIFALNGLFQSAVLPGTVTIMGNWFGQKNRGLIMGIWCCNSMIGNIIGSQIGGLMDQLSDLSWQYSILIPCFFMILVSLAFRLLVQEYPPNSIQPQIDSPIGFFNAWKIPKQHQNSVALYASNNAFIKGAHSCILFWLPYYLKQDIGIKGEPCALLMNSFDLAGSLGTITSGVISDRWISRQSSILMFLICSIPTFIALRLGNDSVQWIYFAFTPLSGFFILGAASILQSALTIDLGVKQNIQNQQRSLSVIAGIMDGTGNLGAAFCQILVNCKQIGIISNNEFVFAFMIILSSISTITLLINRMRNHKNKILEEELK